MGDLPPTTPYGLRRGNSITPLNLPPGVPPSLKRATGGTGMFTRCPSPTAFALGLGPTHPAPINVAQETLGFRRPGFAPGLRYSCRHSLFPWLQPASQLTFSAGERSPTNEPSALSLPPSARKLTADRRWLGARSEASAPGFSPDELSAQDHSTSELLRTLSRMAASKPTSWLSERPHILSH